jgi:histidinol phosphatase-like enzyme (inositol monophosphatase family)
MNPLTDDLQFANRLADAARAAILPHFRQPLMVTDKGAVHFDPVTEADRGAETAMRALLKKERPLDGILGEEYGEVTSVSGRACVLDPIDGTRSFISGQPLWGTLIALEEGGVPVLGLIDQPATGERFVGAGDETFRHADGAKSALHVRPCNGVAAAAVMTTHPWDYFDAEEEAAFGRVAHAARMSRFGGDCTSYALLAAGFVDLIVEAQLHPWDIAALIPVVEGAGGVVTDWTGGPCANGGRVVAAGDRRVHAEALKLLNAAA